MTRSLFVGSGKDKHGRLVRRHIKLPFSTPSVDLVQNRLNDDSRVRRPIAGSEEILLQEFNIAQPTLLSRERNIEIRGTRIMYELHMIT